MKILQYVTDLWTMNITFYKEKLNPLSSLMTRATYWCKKQTAIVLVNGMLPQPNQILALYFIPFFRFWIGVPCGQEKTSSGDIFVCKMYLVDTCWKRPFLQAGNLIHFTPPYLQFLLCSTTNTSEKYERKQQGNLLHPPPHTLRSAFRDLILSAWP